MLVHLWVSNYPFALLRRRRGKKYPTKAKTERENEMKNYTLNLTEEKLEHLLEVVGLTGLRGTRVVNGNPYDDPVTYKITLSEEEYALWKKNRWRSPITHDRQTPRRYRRGFFIKIFLMFIDKALMLAI